MVPPKKKRRENFEQPPESSHSLPYGEEQISDLAELASLGVEPDDNALQASLKGEEDEPISLSRTNRGLGIGTLSPPQPRLDVFDFFSRLANYPEIFMELATHLRIRQFMSLYSICKDFHETVNGHLMHVMKRCAQKRAPESAKIYMFPLYRSLCVPDPVGRKIPNRPDEVRQVPSLKWLQMVYHRERVVRDILAFLAREGHRCPKGTSLSLKKMWLAMDISTSKRRSQLFHNESFISDFDLYNMQLFMIKLEMRFNDPVDGPGDDGLRRLLMGQRGLSVLWRVLRREALKTGLDLVKMAIRYCHYHQLPNTKLPMFGIPAEEIGKDHLEGWGKGRIHLYRPDELVMRESIRRNLKLSDHLRHMMIWGYVDPITRQNIAVTEEEMYMSDDDEEDGGTLWSDREKTGWREPQEVLQTKPEVKEEEKKEERAGDEDDWMTDVEDGDEDDGDPMEVDDESSGGSETSSSDDDGLDDDFLESMEVDDEGNLLTAAA